MFYKIMNRNRLDDYGGISPEVIEDISYSLDNKTVVLKVGITLTQTETVKEITELEFNELKELFNNERSTIQTVKPESSIEQLRLENAQANAELFEMMLMLTGGGTV